MQEQHCAQEGEWEEAKEEVLTYVLSELPPSTLHHTRRKVPSKHERHRLELLARDNANREFSLKDAVKQATRIESAVGKVFNIGSVTMRSNFECGNLANVSLIGPSTYELELERQSNSTRSSAWFYFSVEGLRGEGHFVIKGFTKSSSLYSEGMKVCYREMKDMNKWRRGGSRIAYLPSYDAEEQSNLYELRFSHFFKNNQHSCIEFAYAFPYGLKKLHHLIAAITPHAHAHSLAKTFLGQDIPLLTLGNSLSEKVIVLSARVHPGQTVSSFIMEGFLRQLTSDSEWGRVLRQHFLFKVVPMLNPDGVVKGNYRFSGYGCDLNRKWRSCKQNYQPEVYFMRELLKTINKEKQVMMYIDLHGHSRKKNVFFYGCCEKGSDNLKPKEFPYLMEKLHDAFRYQNCCFGIQKDKEGTARVTAWKELKIDYVYTLQASFCGSQNGPNYLEADYEKIGRKLCEGIALLFSEDIQNTKTSHPSRAIQQLTAIKLKACKELEESPTLKQVGDYDDSGSDSDPDTGEVPEKDRNLETGMPKNDTSAKNQSKLETKSKKIIAPTKFFSQPSIKERSAKQKSQVSVNEQTKHDKISGTSLRITDRAIGINQPSPRFQRVQIKIANSVNTFEMQSLRASSLHQKNLRVHSLTRNNDRFSERNKPLAIPIPQTPLHKEERLRINLMLGREGAQYRRVRKLAEQNLQKQTGEPREKVVKELQSSQMEMSRVQTIAPRFYPLSQQRNRRTSADVYFKKQGREEYKRLSINGDEFKVRCQGRQIYL